MTSSFEVAGHNYQARTLDIFDQMIVAKRLMPVLKHIVTPTVLGAAMTEEPATPGRVKSKKAADFVKRPGVAAVLPAIADAIYSLSDEDLKTIISKCMSVVDRQNTGGAFSPVCAPTGEIMFKDITGAHAVQIAWKVVEAHLGDFFSIAQ